MPRYREWDLKCKVYVGNLDQRATKHQVEDIFSKYGPLRNVWVARNPPGKSICYITRVQMKSTFLIILDR